MRRAVDILGIPVDALGWDEALDLVTGWLLRRQGPAAHVVTANPEMIVRAHGDARLRHVLRAAELVVPDGTGVVWAARVLGRPVPGRIAGIDLTTALLGRAAESGRQVFFLGAEPGIAEQAAARLRERLPQLRIAGWHHGYFSQDRNGDVIERINASGADLLLVAMGVPRQELWIADNRDRLNVKVAIGVGGAFDVFAGKVRRAPAWLQRLGLEWAYRVIKEPRRVRRLGALPRFVWRTLRAARRERGRM
jgi:N-acetylglucosaminyldiphosphoundecaprenol N-acetyl-beta-D-mannosaminyltransferase